MLIWRGKHDLHGTTKCTLKDGFNMVGSSVQIADYLVRKVALHLERSQKTDNQHVVADLYYQYEKIV